MRISSWCTASRIRPICRCWRILIRSSFNGLRYDRRGIVDSSVSGGPDMAAALGTGTSRSSERTRSARALTLRSSSLFSAEVLASSSVPWLAVRTEFATPAYGLYQRVKTKSTSPASTIDDRRCRVADATSRVSRST